MKLLVSGQFDGEVRKQALAITAEKEAVLEKAEAICDWTCENTYQVFPSAIPLDRCFRKARENC